MIKHFESDVFPIEHGDIPLASFPYHSWDWVYLSTWKPININHSCRYKLYHTNFGYNPHLTVWYHPPQKNLTTRTFSFSIPVVHVSTFEAAETSEFHRVCCCRRSIRRWWNDATATFLCFASLGVDESRSFWGRQKGGSQASGSHDGSMGMVYSPNFEWVIFMVFM